MSQPEVFTEPNSPRLFREKTVGTTLNDEAIGLFRNDAAPEGSLFLNEHDLDTAPCPEGLLAKVIRGAEARNPPSDDDCSLQFLTPFRYERPTPRP